MPPCAQNTIRCLKIAGILLFIAAFGFLRPVQAASARESVRQGNRLYGQGEFADSLKKYEEALEKAPESDIVNFNAGTAFYKQKQYDEAIAHFQKTILSDDASLRERAYYNLGNSFYRSGIGKEKTDINAAVASLQGSLRHLASALALDKEDQDAQYNYDFVNKELERLRKEQQKQQRQSQQNQDRQKDEGQQQDSPSGEERPGTKDGQIEQPRSDVQRSDQEENSPQSGSGEAQEQKPQEKEQPAGSVSGQELTQSEAQRLLQNYQQTEEPQGLLHVFEEKHETGTVIKDW